MAPNINDLIRTGVIPLPGIDGYSNGSGYAKNPNANRNIIPGSVGELPGITGSNPLYPASPSPIYGSNPLYPAGDTFAPKTKGGYNPNARTPVPGLSTDMPSLTPTPTGVVSGFNFQSQQSVPPLSQSAQDLLNSLSGNNTRPSMSDYEKIRDYLDSLKSGQNTTAPNTGTPTKPLDKSPKKPATEEPNWTGPWQEPIERRDYGEAPSLDLPALELSDKTSLVNQFNELNKKGGILKQQAIQDAYDHGIASGQIGTSMQAEAAQKAVMDKLLPFASAEAGRNATQEIETWRNKTTAAIETYGKQYAERLAKMGWDQQTSLAMAAAATSLSQSLMNNINDLLLNPDIEFTDEVKNKLVDIFNSAMRNNNTILDMGFVY